MKTFLISAIMLTSIATAVATEPSYREEHEVPMVPNHHHGGARTILPELSATYSNKGAQIFITNYSGDVTVCLYDNADNLIASDSVYVYSQEIIDLEATSDFDEGTYTLYVETDMASYQGSFVIEQ